MTIDTLAALDCSAEGNGCASGEEREHHGVEGDGLDGASEAAGATVAAEDGDGGGVLVATQEPAAAGIEREVASQVNESRIASSSSTICSIASPGYQVGSA